MVTRCIRCAISRSTYRYVHHSSQSSLAWKYLTDDEKFLFKHELKAEQTLAFAKDNARDIIAVGFKLEKTFIFSDFEYVGGAFYRNVSKISRQITLNQAKATFGFNDSYVSQVYYCADSPYNIFVETILAKFTLRPYKLRHHSPTRFLKSLAKSRMSLA